jgi:hypothetical protein
VLLVSGCSYVPIQNSVPEDTVREGNAKEEKLAERLQKAAELYGMATLRRTEGESGHNVLCGRKPPCDQACSTWVSSTPATTTRRGLQEVHGHVPESGQGVSSEPLVPQAKTWIGVLDVIEKSKEVDME